MQAMMYPLLLLYTEHMHRQLPIAKDGLTNQFLIQLLSRNRETNRGVSLFQKLIMNMKWWHDNSARNGTLARNTGNSIHWL